MQWLMGWVIGSFLFLLGYVLGALLSRFSWDRARPEPVNETPADDGHTVRPAMTTALTPGLAEPLLVPAVGRASGGTSRRIQMVPDVMPRTARG